jgi:hypothetical protein
VEPRIDRLRAMSDQELIAEHDRVAEHTQIGTEFCPSELARRDAARQTAKVVKLTRVITWLTGIMTVLTALSLLAVLRAG